MATERVLTQQRAAQTRRHIVDLAARRFAERGYAGTSLNELIAESGLTKGAFYFHFPSKEDLALAAFIERQQQLIDHLMQAAADAPDALSALRAMARQRAELLARDPSFHVVLRLGAELGAGPQPAAAFTASLASPIGAIEALIRRGQKEGSIRRRLAPRMVAECIFAAIVGSDELSHMLGESSNLAGRSAALIELLIEGFGHHHPGSPK